MLERVTAKPYGMFGIGLSLGLMLAAGILVGAWARGPAVSSLGFPQTLVDATATHGGTSMAMATGPIDEGVEGLFVLDFITGELQATVVNPRTGAIGGLYKHNVVADLGVEQGKQPKYLMVTGAANFRYGGGNVRPAQSIVYIADENTGNFVAYMLPWNRAASQYNFAQVNPLVPIGKGSARNVELE